MGKESAKANGSLFSSSSGRNVWVPHGRSNAVVLPNVIIYKAMSQNTLDDICTSFNPRVPTVEDLEKIFMAYYNGEKVS